MECQLLKKDPITIWPLIYFKFGKDETNNNLDKAIKSTCFNNVTYNQLQKALT